MSAKELESLIKNTLKSYVLDYNKINPEDKLDFNLSFTTHKFDVSEIDGYDLEDPKFSNVAHLDGETLYYLRIAKVLLDKSEKRVIFTAYRPAKSMKKDVAHKSMLLESVRQLMIGGLEYSEAIYQMNEKRIEEEEESEENQP